MTAYGQSIKPVRGMTFTFKPTASASLAGIPATMIDIWPRFRSGDYLVTLEFERPVQFRTMFIRHIDAFVSELDALDEPRRGTASARSGSGWWGRQAA